MSDVRDGSCRLNEISGRGFSERLVSDETVRPRGSEPVVDVVVITVADADCLVMACL